MIEMPMWQESIRNGVQGKVKEDYPDATYVPSPITCIKSQPALSTISGRTKMSTVQEIAFSFSFSAMQQHKFQEKLTEPPKSHAQMGRRAKLGTLTKSHSDM